MKKILKLAEEEKLNVRPYVNEEALARRRSRRNEAKREMKTAFRYYMPLALVAI